MEVIEVTGELEVVDLDELDEQDTLSELVPSTNKQKIKAKMVSTDSIVTPRGLGDPVAKDFVQSVELFGFIQPLVVRPLDDQGYELIDGRRRLQAARQLELRDVPVVLETRNSSEASDVMMSLAANYQRSENYVGDARSVWLMLDSGISEKMIGKAAGMTLAQVRRLRDLRKLHPELLQAAEDGLMSVWSAGMAARLGERQEQLVDVLHEKGKVTSDDVIAARQVNRDAAVASLPTDLFDAPSLDEAPEFSEDDLDTELGDAAESFMVAPLSDKTGEKVSEATPKKMTRSERYVAVTGILASARAEMMKIKAPRKIEEDGVIAEIESLIDTLKEMAEA